MSQSVLVVGSINHDSIYFMERLPKPHETLPAREFITAPGGKGSNQAVACAQSTDGHVQLLGCVGTDMHADMCVAYLREHRVDISRLVTVEDAPTGTACVMVEDSGDNLIVVSAGANGKVSGQIVQDSDDMFRACGVVLLQLEVPLETVKQCLERARALGKTSILNPAPYIKGVEAIVHLVDIFTPNQAEASSLTGIDVTDAASAKEAAALILAMGVKHVVITLAGEGSVVASAEGMEHVAAYKVDNVVDTTGAGDVYNGAFAAAMSDGVSVLEAARFASAAAALSVQKPSASYCAPTKAQTRALQAR